jgi:hypothetical protein
LGPSAAKILKWPKTTRLLLDLSRECVSHGATSPRGARGLLRLQGRDLKIRSLFGLHAKMLAFDRVAYVGSANLSESSSRSLIEAAVRFSTAAEVAKVRKEIQRLAKDGDRVLDDARLDALVELEPPRRGASGRAHRPESSSARVPRWVVDGRSVWIDAIEPEEPQKVTRNRQYVLAASFEASGDVEDRDAVEWSVLHRFTYKEVPADDWLFVWWRPKKRTPYGQIEGPFRCLGGHDLGKRCGSERWERGEAPVASRRRSLDGPALRALSSFVARAARSSSTEHAAHLHHRIANRAVELETNRKRRALHALIASLDRRKR